MKQECIPVGCVPSAAVAVSRGGGVPGPRGCVYLVLGVYLVPRGGVYLVPVGGVYLVPGGGVYLVRGGVPGPGGVTWSGWGCAWSWVVYLVPGGVCSRGVHWAQGGVPSPGGESAPQGECTWSGTPPRGQTDACKNITFATSLRTVIKVYNNLGTVQLVSNRH